MAKKAKVEPKKEGFKLGPISGNVLLVTIAVLVIGVLAFIYFGFLAPKGAGTGTGTGTDTGDNALQSANDVGATVLDIGKGVGDISSLLKELDQMIG